MLVPGVEGFASDAVKMRVLRIGIKTSLGDGRSFFGPVEFQWVLCCSEVAQVQVLVVFDELIGRR